MNITQEDIDKMMTDNPDLARVNRRGNPLPAPAEVIEQKKQRSHEEDELLGRIIEVAHLNHWLVAHFRPAMLKDGTYRTAVSADGKGFPDLVLVRELPGQPLNDILFVELKSSKGKLSIEQTLWRMMLEKSLCEYWLIRPEKEHEFYERLAR